MNQKINEQVNDAVSVINEKIVSTDPYNIDHNARCYRNLTLMDIKGIIKSGLYELYKNKFINDDQYRDIVYTINSHLYGIPKEQIIENVKNNLEFFNNYFEKGNNIE